MRIIVLIKYSLAISALLGIASPRAAPNVAKGDSVCQVGARVTDRQNRSGVVADAKGSDCYVKLDGSTDAKPGYYLAWMLKPEGAGKQVAAAGGNELARGRYDCWAAAGVAGTLKLEITGNSTYSGNGKTGSYAYDAKTQKIIFSSGPWAGFFGARFAAGKIGISSRPGGFYGTTCDLK